MRVVWKDSNTKKEYKPIRYRKNYIFGSPDGWEVAMPGDYNIYKTHYSAMNAIDLALGDTKFRGTKKKINYGIEIIGTKDHEIG